MARRPSRKTAPELYHNLVLTDLHYLQLGRITAMWAAVEFAVQRLLWFVLELDEAAGHKHTTRRSMKDLLSELEA